MVKKELGGVKTYVITSAQGIQNPHSAEMFGKDNSKGSPNKQLIENIEKYAKKEDGELRIVAIAGSYVNEMELDASLRERNDVYMNKKTFARLEAQRAREKSQRDKWEEAREIAENSEKEFKRKYPCRFFRDEISDKAYHDVEKKLNKKVGLIGIPEPPQNRDPTSGNTDLTSHLEESVIFGSPKQRLKPVAKNMSGKHPRIIVTTGCCTHPNYNETNRMGNRAARDHQYGFVVVDVLGDEFYLPRLVPARKDGTFVDMGVKYSPGKDPIKVKTTSLILGDLHIPNQDSRAIKASEEMVDYFKPGEVYIHDAFDAQSINVHNLDDELIAMWNYEERISNLEEEVSLVRDYLIKTAEQMPYGKVRVVASNHDDMLRRWLAKGRYRGDGQNARFAHKIISKINPTDMKL